MEHPVNLLSAELQRKQAKALVRSFGDRFNNRDACIEDHAVDGLLAGRPAFWSTSRNDADAGALCFEANHLSSIAAAFTEVARCSLSRFLPVGRRIELLNKLIPLNDQAVRELLDGYLACGTFSTSRELYDRAAAPILNAADREAGERV